MIRAALYARVSTDNQDPGMQLRDMRSYCQARGWQLDPVDLEFVDVGWSGSTDHRPQLDRLYESVKNGLVDVVVVWKWDRLARSTRHLIDAFELFRQHNVQFVNVTEQIDTSTPTGKMVFTIMAALAEFERNLIQERVKAGLRHAQEQGVKLGRPKMRGNVVVDRLMIMDAMQRNKGSLKKAAYELNISYGSAWAMMHPRRAE